MNLDYIQSINLILDRIELNKSQFINGQLPRNWLLCPVELEFDEKDMQKIASFVTDYLFNEYNSNVNSLTTHFRRKINSLQGLQLLPFLYITRYVSSRWGSVNRFYPQINEFIFDSKIDVNVLRQLGPDMSNSWIKLYKHSSMTLFYPREGRINIKWPFSHAGLISQEKILLKDYFESYNHVETNDIEEFKLSLIDWLTNKHPNATLLKRLSSEIEVSMITAEIALLYIHQLRENDDSGHVKLALFEMNNIRRTFKYDLANKKLALSISGNWEERISKVLLNWNKTELLWPIVYHPSSRKTIGDSVIIHVDSPSWTHYFYISTDDQSKKYSLITSPFNKGTGAMLFDRDSLLRVRSWAPEREYLLLIHKHLMGNNILSELFVSLNILHQLSDEWKDYIIVTGQSRNFYENILPDSIHSELERMSQLMSQAGLDFKIPSYSELIKPNIRPVFSVNYQENGIDCYSSSAPPLFYITFRLKQNVRVVLARYDDNGVENIISTKNINLQSNHKSVVVEPFVQGTERGKYSLTVLDERYNFLIVDTFKSEYSNVSINIGLFYENEIVYGQYFESEILNNCMIFIKGWAYANLNLLVKVNDFERSFHISLDEKGEVKFFIQDFFNKDIPVGHIEIQCFHSFIQSNVLVFSNGEYVTDISHEWTQESKLKINGKIHNNLSDNELTCILVLWSEGFNQTVNSRLSCLDCSFNAEILVQSNRQNIKWLLIESKGIILYSAELSGTTEMPFPLIGTFPMWYQPVSKHMDRRGSIYSYAKLIKITNDLNEISYLMTRRNESNRKLLKASYSVIKEIIFLSGLVSNPCVFLVPKKLQSTFLMKEAISEDDSIYPGYKLNLHELLNLTLHNSDEIIISDSGVCTVVNKIPKMLCINCGRLLPLDDYNYHAKSDFVEEIRCNNFIKLKSEDTLEVEFRVLWTPTLFLELLKQGYNYIKNKGDVSKLPNQYLKKLQLFLSKVSIDNSITSNKFTVVDELFWATEKIITIINQRKLEMLPQTRIDTVYEIYERQKEAILHLLEWIDSLEKDVEGL